MKQHKARAAGWYRTAARNGDANAQYNLGLCHESGIGVDADMATAFDRFSKAAHQDNAEAQFTLGNCYENRTGVKKDMAAAFAWFGKAACQGLALGQLNPGMCYEHGTGVDRDYAKAADCHEKAADQGCAKSKQFLNRSSSPPHRDVRKIPAMSKTCVFLCAITIWGGPYLASNPRY